MRMQNMKALTEAQGRAVICAAAVPLLARGKGCIFRLDVFSLFIGYIRGRFLPGTVASLWVGANHSESAIEHGTAALSVDGSPVNCGGNSSGPLLVGAMNAFGPCL